MSDERLPWIPTMKEVAALRELIEDNEATIAALKAENIEQQKYIQLLERAEPAPNADAQGVWTPLEDGKYVYDSIIDGRIELIVEEGGDYIRIIGPEDMYESLSLSPLKYRLCRLTGDAPQV